MEPHSYELTGSLGVTAIPTTGALVHSIYGKCVLEGHAATEDFMWTASTDTGAAPSTWRGKVDIEGWFKNGDDEKVREAAVINFVPQDGSAKISFYGRGRSCFGHFKITGTMYPRSDSRGYAMKARKDYVAQVGCRVVGVFPCDDGADHSFFGIVTAYDTSEKEYTVEYEDGEEHMYAEKNTEQMVLRAQSSAAGQRVRRKGCKAGKKKGKRKKKPGVYPKGAICAPLLYANENYHSFKADHPGETKQSIMSELCRKYAGLSCSEKAPWEKKYAEAKARSKQNQVSPKKARSAHQTGSSATSSPEAEGEPGARTGWGKAASASEFNTSNGGPRKLAQKPKDTSANGIRHSTFDSAPLTSNSKEVRGVAVAAATAATQELVANNKALTENAGALAQAVLQSVTAQKGIHLTLEKIQKDMKSQEEKTAKQGDDIANLQQEQQENRKNVSEQDLRISHLEAEVAKLRQEIADQQTAEAPRNSPAASGTLPFVWTQPRMPTAPLARMPTPFEQERGGPFISF